MSNDNWAICPKCGAPVLVDPATHLPGSAQVATPMRCDKD